MSNCFNKFQQSMQDKINPWSYLEHGPGAKTCSNDISDGLQFTEIKIHMYMNLRKSIACALVVKILTHTSLS